MSKIDQLNAAIHNEDLPLEDLDLEQIIEFYKEQENEE